MAYNPLRFTVPLLFLHTSLSPKQSQKAHGVAESDHVLGGSSPGNEGGAMLQIDALIVDYGPKFAGTAVRTDQGIVCVVPRQIRDRPEAGAAMADLVRDLGGECGRCQHCPLGRAG